MCDGLTFLYVARLCYVILLLGRLCYVAVLILLLGRLCLLGIVLDVLAASVSTWRGGRGLVGTLIGIDIHGCALWSGGWLAVMMW